MAVRAATGGHSKPPAQSETAVSTEAPTPKVQERPDAPVDTVTDRRPQPKRSNMLLIVITIAFLALAAFAGNYMGARSRTKE